VSGKLRKERQSKSMNQKKALVTGGAGFIGSNVVDLLLKKGWHVTVVDNLSTGFITNLDLKNENLEFWELDILSEEFDLHWSHDFAKFNKVFHLAALPRVEPSIRDPLTSNKQNVDATLKIFENARKSGVTDIVFSSSSSVYGDAENVPTGETEPVNPMSPYALQKLICDQYAKLYCDLYDMNITCLRYFNVYGRHEPVAGAYVPVVGIWLRQQGEGSPLTITGDGEQSRDFVNVSDVAAVNLGCAEVSLRGFNVFNVGSGKTHSLNYLASLISDNTTYISQRFEPKYTCADISKLEKQVGWVPKHTIESYLSDKKKSLKNE